MTQKAFEPSEQWDREFRVRPTCPPSTSVMVEAGKMFFEGGEWGWGANNVLVPQNQIDFSDPAASRLSWVLSFNQANFYRAAVVCYNMDYIQGHVADTPIFYTVGGTTEHRTAEEAEDEIDGLLNGADPLTLSYQNIPIWSAVLRNNGMVGVDGAVLPVDRVNRGRSFLYRDCRIRSKLTA